MRHGEHVIGFDVFYNNPSERHLVYLRCPSESVARALANYMDEHADKTPRDTSGNPHPLLTHTAEHGAKLGKVLDDICERLSNLEVRQECNNRQELDEGDKSVLDDIIKRTIKLENEVKEQERLRALQETHITHLYGQIESQKDKLATAIANVIKPDRIADPERIDRVLSAMQTDIDALKGGMKYHKKQLTEASGLFYRIDAFLKSKFGINLIP